MVTILAVIICEYHKDQKMQYHKYSNGMHIRVVSLLEL